MKADNAVKQTEDLSTSVQRLLINTVVMIGSLHAMCVAVYNFTRVWCIVVTTGSYTKWFNPRYKHTKRIIRRMSYCNLVLWCVKWQQEGHLACKNSCMIQCEKVHWKTENWPNLTCCNSRTTGWLNTTERSSAICRSVLWFYVLLLLFYVLLRSMDGRIVLARSVSQTTWMTYGFGTVSFRNKTTNKQNCILVGDNP